MDDSQPLTLFVEPTDLTEPEQNRLVDLEVTVERGLKTFVEVGTALLEIRDSRLYRQTHSTFEDYCRERWNLSRPRAYQLIEAAEVSQNLSTIVDTLPATESQARPLTRLEPDAQRDVWQQAVESAPNGKPTAAHVQQVADKYEEDHADPEPAPQPKMAVHYSSETPEHYTPEEIIDAVVACMGEIDLDPCSNSKTDPNVPAARHYTAEDDGLCQFWEGRIYMNPPYGRQIGQWIDKLCEAYRAGDVSESIALVPARTDTAWWARLNEMHPFVCFVRGRLTFGGNEDAAPFPSAVVYLGNNYETFYSEFLPFGEIYQRLNCEMFGS